METLDTKSFKNNKTKEPQKKRTQVQENNMDTSCASFPSTTYLLRDPSNFSQWGTGESSLLESLYVKEFWKENIFTTLILPDLEFWQGHIKTSQLQDSSSLQGYKYNSSIDNFHSQVLDLQHLASNALYLFATNLTFPGILHDELINTPILVAVPK